jgi:hypothetical protein
MTGLAHAARALLAAYEARGGKGEGATPAQLIEALEQAMAAFAALDRAHGPAGALKEEDASALGEYALACLSDLNLWVQRLGCDEERHWLDQATLEVADWVVRHGGRLRVLEPLVNALATRANRLRTQEALAVLFDVIGPFIDRVDPAIRDDPDRMAPEHPWRILLFNYAIVATRTQDPERMARAYCLMEAWLPEACPEFFEEALRQSRKPVYGDEVRTLVREYHRRWTARH